MRCVRLPTERSCAVGALSFRKNRTMVHGFAEDGNHAWVQKLDVSKIDFGKGKRMLVKGGQFDSTYNITVPVTDSART